MTKDDLRAFVIAVTKYYGLERVIDSERLSAWYEHVRTIPAEALDFIKAEIYREKDSMPRNMPKIMRDLFGIWLSQHPDKKAAQQDRQPCDECGGKGLLWFKDHTEQHKVARCQSCRNWLRNFTGAEVSGVPALMTVDQIQQEGGHLV